MAVVLLALVATVVEVVGSSAIPEKGCGRNNGTLTSSQSLRKTSINSIPTLPGGLRYVVSMVLKVLRNSTRNVLPPARVAVMQSVMTTELASFFFQSCSKRLNSTEGPKPLQSREETAQILLQSFMKPASHVSLK